MRLAGRSAIVTGAGNGIGKACAIELARHGAMVVVNDLGTDEYGAGRTSKAAEKTVSEIEDLGGKAIPNCDSVADSAGCEALVHAGVAAYGQVDIVVACAGALLDATLQASDDDYRRFIDLFLSQKFWLARATIPAMVERGWGRLITTTSHGATGLLGSPIFAAAMGGVISLTKAIAFEQQGTGVTANCLAPGAQTRLAKKTHARFEAMHEAGQISDEDWDRFLDQPPPKYVAPIVAWLGSDAASGVSGEVFHATGGLVSRWTRYEDERGVYRGDHRTVAPWTLDELDSVVPKMLL
ncbi:MAG TPA: SDR family NAD(P)-dependent oxidoreductase [Acidimicrobiales bacterium]|nr:SDR family NAD(P)-dependent oxidoreductase [Acidimicrobiales bacterium]